MTRRCSVLKNAVIVIPCFLFFVVFVLSACRKSGTTAAQRVQTIQNESYRSDDERETYKSAAGLVESTVAFTPPVIAEDEAAYVEAPPAPPAPSASPADIPKKIIKEGTLGFTVRDFKSARKELLGIIAGSGGSVISDKESRSEVTWSTMMEVRVPAEKFDSCLNALAGIDEQLFSKEISSKDVTEEYVDMSARMKARKEVEQRYLDILKQAKTVEDILKVEEQLKTIREEVEAAQGRPQYIDHNVSMSIIHLSFAQHFSNTTPQGPGFFSSILFSVKDGWNHVLATLISFIGLWPVWIAVVAAIIIIRRYRKRRSVKAVA